MKYIPKLLLALLLALGVGSMLLATAPQAQAADPTVFVFCRDGAGYPFIYPAQANAICKMKGSTVMATIATPSAADVTAKGRFFIVCNDATVTQTKDGSSSNPFCAKPGAGGVYTSNIAAAPPATTTNPMPTKDTTWAVVFCNDGFGGISQNIGGGELCYGHGGLLSGEDVRTVPNPNDLYVLCKSGRTVKTTNDKMATACPDGFVAGVISATGQYTTDAEEAAGLVKICGGAQLATPGLNLICTGTGGPIYGLINFAINWLIGILGGLAILAVIIGGIQYTASQGNPDALKKAKSRIMNAVIGLVVLSLMFVILKFIGIG